MKSSTLKKILFALIIITSAVTYAQRPPAKNRLQEKKENIESMKIAFITQKLDLTPDEAQKFWPVFDQYSDKLKELRRKRRQDGREAKQNFDTMSDKDLELAIDNNLSIKQQELDLQKEYNSKFKAVLPMKKVAKLYAAEEQFKMVLIDRLKNREPEKE